MRDLSSKNGQPFSQAHRCGRMTDFLSHKLGKLTHLQYPRLCSQSQLTLPPPLSNHSPAPVDDVSAVRDAELCGLEAGHGWRPSVKSGGQLQLTLSIMVFQQEMYSNVSQIDLRINFWIIPDNSLRASYSIIDHLIYTLLVPKSLSQSKKI